MVKRSVVKKPLFRKTLNKAITAKEIYKKQIPRVKEEMARNIDRILRTEPPKSKQLKYKGFPNKSIQSLEILKTNKAYEDKLITLEMKKKSAERAIRREKKMRTSPLVGSIRLLHAGKPVRQRLARISQRKKTKQKNSP
ncbi:MAG: hypothetical protein BWY55_00946 [archaeon ADurb.Bin336]|nr:MAG: hypothetical protein BWY55_00946 [archaeon ADurb.Bin336]